MDWQQALAAAASLAGCGALAWVLLGVVRLPTREDERALWEHPRTARLLRWWAAWLAWLAWGVLLLLGRWAQTRWSGPPGEAGAVRTALSHGAGAAHSRFHMVIIVSQWTW